MKPSSGFTLIELLVVMAIVVILLGLAIQLIQGTSRISRNSISTAGGIEHVQQAANIIADDVRRALAIVDPGNAAYVGVSAIGAPANAGNSLLALTTLKLPGSVCTTDYEYFVYYFVDRSVVSGGNEWTTVAIDSSNSSKKALIQFSACADKPDPSTAILSNELVRVVSDYIGTGTFVYKLATVGKYRQVTLSLTPSQVISGTTITGQTITTVALARNIY